MSRYSKLKERRELLKIEGMCIDCKKDRGEKGTSVRCRVCADKANYPAKMRGVPVLYACTDIEAELGELR